MILTVQQREAAERGDPIPVVLPGSAMEFVIVRRDLVTQLIPNADYPPCDPDDLLLLAAESLDSDEDWTMPANHPFTPIHQ